MEGARGGGTEGVVPVTGQGLAFGDGLPPGQGIAKSPVLLLQLLLPLPPLLGEGGPERLGGGRVETVRNPLSRHRLDEDPHGSLTIPIQHPLQEEGSE